MGLLVSKTDFVGNFALSKTISDKIDAFIDEFEEQYLIDLLGAELFKLFKADVDAPTKKPETDIYLAIYNEINEDYSGCVMRSKGLKDMILGFIWFEYVRATAYSHTGTGIVAGSNEVSKNVGLDDSYIYRNYNASVAAYGVIQWYICNTNDYPLFNGQNKLLAWRL